MIMFCFFSLPVVTEVGFFCLSSHQPCFRWLSRYWRYLSKPFKSDKTTLSPWYFSWKKTRSIIFKNILVRAIYCTEMLMSPLFLLKLEVLKKMETQIQNHGIKFSLRFFLSFCLSLTKCYKEWNLSKNCSNDFQRKSFEKFMHICECSFLWNFAGTYFRVFMSFVGIFGKCI